jgi:hypothetical protein
MARSSMRGEGKRQLHFVDDAPMRVQSERSFVRQDLQIP